MEAVKSKVSDFIHLFFPHICLACGTDVLATHQQLCLKCLSQLPSTGFFNQPGNPVEQKFYGRIPVRNAGAAYFFTKDSTLENLIYQLKYRGNKNIGHYLGKLMGQAIVETERFNNIDVIVPLPLNKKRQRKRGYNQATVLAKGITSVWEKPIAEHAVKRNVYTETQTQKGRITRWENMANVFGVAQAELIENKHVLLIDDVVTTGASLEACALEILKVPGTTVSIATLAYTI